jgi:hypothetical protein
VSGDGDRLEEEEFSDRVNYGLLLLCLIVSAIGSEAPAFQNPTLHSVCSFKRFGVSRVQIFGRFIFQKKHGFCFFVLEWIFIG